MSEDDEDEDDELDELGMLDDELLAAPALSFELPHAARPSGRARARAAMVLRRAVRMV
jgi:hypothetical protein